MNSPPFTVDPLQPYDPQDDDSPPNLQAEQPFALEQQYPPVGPQLIASTSDENMPVLNNFTETNNVAEELTEETDVSCSLEFEFIDENTVSCGICGQAVLYTSLFSFHLPRVHPEIKVGNVTVEDVTSKEERPVFVSRIPILEDLRPVRKVSQFRIVPEMNLDVRNKFLQRKLVEKIGKRLPVTLIAKDRVNCGLCFTPISINKKFEISNVIRHFSSWHFAHTCSGKWMTQSVYKNGRKSLSIEDFVVVNIKMSAVENIQCIWCGDAFSSADLCEHFVAKHADQVMVPKCYLCLEEMIVNARMLEKYRQYFEITIQDENQYKCANFQKTFQSEKELDLAIMKRFREYAGAKRRTCTKAEESEEMTTRKRVSNGLMSFGLHYKKKRRFVQPHLRQAIPEDSKFVTEVTKALWRCKLCDEAIVGAVMSAATIKHYKLQHSAQLEDLQYELVKARLGRVSGGCMEFIHPQLLDCLMCCRQYKLHKPYNISRAIRHLKSLHAGVMPEYYEQRATNQEEGDSEAYDHEEETNEEGEESFEEGQNEESQEEMESHYVDDQNPAYLMLNDDEIAGLNSNGELIDDVVLNEKKIEPMLTKEESQDSFSRDDPFGLFDEDVMLHDMEAQVPGTFVETWSE